MMTEKRFTLRHYDEMWEIKDNQGGSLLTLEKIENMLNEQYETIRNLKIKAYCQDQEIQKLLQNIQELETSIRKIIWLTA